MIFVSILALWVRNKFFLAPQSAATGASVNVLVLAENRWLCDALRLAGFAQCEHFDLRTLHESDEFMRTIDDLDVLARIASATHVVLGESSVQLINVAISDVDADRQVWSDELARLLASLAARFRIDASRVILVPGVPPRDLVDAVDLAPVHALLEQRAAPLVRVAPTWCTFERVVRERNDTTYAYMPDNVNVNHHGSYAVAAMIHAHFRPNSAWKMDQKLPDGMTAEMALFYYNVVQDCLR